MTSDVSAVAVLSGVSAESLDGFIILNTNTTTPSNGDPKTFTINANVLYSVLDGSTNEPNIESSDVIVTTQPINSAAESNTIKDDVVRSLAYQITGGYGASDIFANENLLIDDIDDLDNIINDKIAEFLDPIAAVSEIDASSNNNIFERLLNNLFSVIINDDDESDGTPGRRTLLYNLLNDASGNGNNTTISAPLKFVSGDVLTFRIVYNPATSIFATNGVTIHPRSYRIVLPLI